MHIIHRIVLACGLFLGFCVSAIACPDGQYDACVLSGCICVPDSGALTEQFKNAVNPLPDIINVGNAVIHTDLPKLEQAIGAIAIKNACKSCEILKENVMDHQHQRLVEQIVGRGLIFMYEGVPPEVIAADATQLVTFGFKPSSTTSRDQPRVSQQDAKHYAIEDDGGCASDDGEGNIAVGWHAQPTLLDAQDDEVSDEVLRPGDVISIDLDSDCPSVTGLRSSTVTMTYSYTAHYPAYYKVSPTYVLVGQK